MDMESLIRYITFLLTIAFISCYATAFPQKPYGDHDTTITVRTCQCNLKTSNKKIPDVVLSGTEYKAYPYASCHRVRRECSKFCKAHLQEYGQINPLRKQQDGLTIGYIMCQSLNTTTYKTRVEGLAKVSHCSHHDIFWKGAELCCGPIDISLPQDEGKKVRKIAWEPDCDGHTFYYQ